MNPKSCPAPEIGYVTVLNHGSKASISDSGKIRVDMDGACY